MVAPRRVMLVVVFGLAVLAWFLFAPRFSEIVGQVLIGDQPAPGVTVRWQGEAVCTFTDADGRFRLPRSTRPRLTASKAGFLIATAPAHSPTLELQPVPTADNDAYQWIDPAPHLDKQNNCGNCHQQVFEDWSTSAHAKSASNPHFLGIFENLLTQKPEGAGVCAACHAPTFRDPTFEYDFRRLKGVASRGVHCDYCHKVADTAPDLRGLRFGRDGYDLRRPFDDKQLFFGPLDDAHREGELFGYAPIFKKSEYCASCHEGVLFGVKAYGTYSEWLESPAKSKGQQCQTCHMAPTGKLTNIAPGKGGIERDPSSLSSHRVEGATPEMLKRCLKLGVNRVSMADGERVEVEVLAEDVGHRVPTGFIDRHLALVVEAFDGAARPVKLRQGTTLPAYAGVEIAGKAGWLYAKVLKGEKGPLPFWLGREEPTDTRLRPGMIDRREFLFGPGVERVRVRLLYRRFWPEVAGTRGWKDNETVVIDRVIERMAQ